MNRSKTESAYFQVPDEAPRSSTLNRPKSTKSWMACAGLLLMGLLPGAANAATKTWDGGSTTTNNWTDGVNWDNDTAPVAGDSLVFAGATRLAPVNDFAANTQFNGISFSATAGAFVITGSAINMGGDLSDSSAAIETLRIPMTLLQNETVTVNTGGSLTVNTVVATFTSVLTTGSVSAVNITNGGSGYAPNASLPLTFTAAPTGGTNATGTANTNANGVVTSVTITNAGSGYLVAPTVTLGALSTIFSQVQDATPATPRSLTKIGAGTLTLGSGTFVNGAGMVNTYTGGTIVNAGTLVLSPPSSIGVGVIRGQLDINAGATVNLTSNDNALGFTATPAGAATVKVETVNINGGTLNTATNNGVRTNFFLNGGTLGGAGAFTFETPFSLTTVPSATTSTVANIALRSVSVPFNVPQGTTPNGIDLNVTGVLSGNPVTSGLNKLGTGTIALSGSNTFTGTTTLSGGLVQLSASNRLADTSGLTFNGGNFSTAGFSDTVGALGLSASSTLDLGNGASTLTFAGTAATFTAGATLSVANYTAGTDHIFINNAAVPTASQLAQIVFVASDGTTVAAQRLSSNEIVPIGSVTEVYWQGDVDNNWTTNIGGNTNWASDAAGTADLGRLPGAGDNVIFATSNAANLPTTVLGSDFSIRSLIVNTATGLSVGGTNNLTLSSAGISLGSAAGPTLIGTSGQVILNGEQTWANNTAAGGNALTVSSTVSGAGIIKTGTGPLNLSGANTYTGATTINAGILTVSGGAAIADSAAVVTANTAGVSFNLASNETVGSLSGGGTTGGGVTLGANTLSVNGAGSNVTYAGIISGTGGLTKVGTGVQTLSGVNTLSGVLTVNGGTLTLAALNNSITTTTANGGTLNLNAGGTAGAIKGTLNINAGATVNLGITDALGFGTGTSVTLVNIVGGTLNNAVNGNNGFLSSFVLTGGSMTSTGGGSYNIASGSGITTNASSTTSVISGNVILRNTTTPASTAPIVFTVAQGTTANGIDLSVSGVISQNGTTSITKTGAGTLLLGGANAYAGATTISVGRLQLGAANRINDGSAVVLSGSTFATGGFSETVGALTLSDATTSTIDLGTGTSVLRFGSLAAGAGTVSVVNYTSGTDQLFIGGTALTGAQLSQISFAIGGNSVAAFQRNTGEVVPAIVSSASTGAILSEYRLSGPSGTADEFIELVNTTASSLDVGGWSVVGGGVTAAIPAGTASIPAFGHLLLTGSAYSLANYGGTNVARGDVNFSGDFATTSSLELRNAAGNLVDTVNTSSLPAPVATTDNYSYVRRLDSGRSLDTDNDLNDFNTVDVQSTAGPNNTTGLSNGILRLGAPGPKNLASPISNNSLITFTPSTSVRVGSGNSGTLALRVVVGNRAGSGRTITGFRFRVVGLTAGATIPANATPADLRLISSTSSDGTNLPLLLQEPPTQPNGGGLNSSVNLASLPGGGLAPGQSVTVELLFNVAQKGTYRYLLNAESVTIASP